MMHPLIKICGFKNPASAQQAAQLGVDFIGIVFHPLSRRFVAINQAKRIVQAVHQQAQCVGVFVNHSAAQIEEIAMATQIKIIQLHGATARQQHHLLAAHYQRIYVQTVLPSGVINADVDQGLQYCDPQRDMLLFDGVQAGTGQPFDWQQFHYRGEFPLGLAGGLTAQNVSLAINKIQPQLVDAATGVENQHGDKDLQLIQQFISNIRGS